MSPTNNAMIISCPRCGNYNISGTQAAIYERNEPDENRQRLSYVVRERTINGFETQIFSDTTIESISINAWPVPPKGKIDKLISSLTKMSGYPGAEIDLEFPADYVLAYTDNGEEFDFYLKSLAESNLIKIITKGMRFMKIQVTTAGYAHVVALKNAHQQYIKENQNENIYGVEETMNEVNIDHKRIFLVHGRDKQAHDEMINFLRSLALDPWDFDRAVTSVPDGAPHIEDVLKWAFEYTWCVIVLITGDDEARLREDFWDINEKNDEKEIRRQPRMNVVFEAGRALALNKRSTIFVQLGDCKGFSDIAGRIIHHFNGTSEERNKLKEVLRTADCNIQESGNWLSAGNFDFIAQRKQGQEKAPTESEGELTAEEKELIITSGKEGKFILMSAGNVLSDWVCAGNKHFMKQEDSAYTARYLEAFDSLQKKGIVKHQSGQLYLLTGTGFKKQKELIKEIT